MLWDIRTRHFPSWNLSFLVNNMETVLGFVLQGWVVSVVVCPTFCDSMDCSTPGSSILHYIPEFAQTHVHWVGDVIQTSHPLSSPSPPALNLSQHQGHSHELALWIRWPKYWEEVNKITQEKVEQGAQQRARPGQRLPSLLLLTLVGDPPSPVSSLGIFSII